MPSVSVAGTHAASVWQINTGEKLVRNESLQQEVCAEYEQQQQRKKETQKQRKKFGGNTLR